MSDTLSRLSALDSCAVSDALDSVGIAGVAHGLRRLSVRGRIVGRAVTVQLGPFEGVPGKRHLCTAAVDSAGPGAIIVIAHDGRTDAAGWGGILSLGAKVRGVAGIVIDGAARDLDESIDMGLPLYGKAPVPATARGRVIETGWDQPVSICGVSVSPGDYVIADESGVVFIPADRIEDIVEMAAGIVEREQLMAMDVRAGKPVADVMGTTYETMLSAERTT